MLDANVNAGNQRVPLSEPVETRSGALDRNRDDNCESRATVASTVVGLSNNIVGAGILSLPWCFKQASIVEGTLLLVLVAGLSGLSLVLTAICCDLSSCFSFRGMGEQALGRGFGVMIQAVMLVYTFFSCVSFMILAGNCFAGNRGIPQGLCGDSCDNWLVQLFETRFLTVLVLTVTLMGPLSFLRDLNALRFTSLLSILGMLYLLCLLAFEYASATPENLPPKGDIHVLTLQQGIFEAAPIVNVAFIAHYNAPRFYQEMQNRSIPKFAKAVAIATTMCGSVYIAVGILGYLRFGSKTASDVLKSFTSATALPVVFGRLAMSGVVMFTFPLAFNAHRLSAGALLKSWAPSFDLSRQSHFQLLTSVLLIALFIPGSELDNIGVVLDYKGAILGGCIAFAFPAWIFLAIADPDSVRACAFKPTALLQQQQQQQSTEAPLLPVLEPERDANADQALLNFWKPVSICFFIYAIVSGVMGVVVTTEKLVENN